MSGDVTIQDGAAIAPGVLLQADRDGRIVIRSGACIGVGAVLHAHQGTVEVGEGANVGAEVLLIGQVSIGANACIGSATTILNSAIAAGEVVPPGSLIGDNSRPEEALQVTDTVVYPMAEAVSNGASAPESTDSPPVSQDESSPQEKAGVNVYGQMYVNQLLVKMFPNSARINQPTSNKPSLASEDPWDD
jgi:carbon dioxide concentrating mechanism protein CcmN